MDWNKFFDFTLKDIVKYTAIVVAIIFIWSHGSALINQFTPDPVNPNPEILKQLENTVAKLENVQANNDKVKAYLERLEEENSDLIARLEEQKEKTKETVSEVSRITAELKQTRDLLNRESDKVYVNPKKPELSYVFKKVYGKDAEGDRFPMAWAMYMPNKTEEQWKTGTYPQTYELNVVETENKDGTFNKYAELYFYNDQMEEVRGERFKLNVDNIEWAKVERKEKFFDWWNPRLSLTGSVATNGIYPSLSLSAMSYGKTTVDMDWQFLTVGLGSDGESLFGHFEPVSWNIGKPLPLVDNLFVGPAVSYDFNEAEVGGGINFRIPF